MTVSAIAKRLNVSTMTVYRRLKRAGINLDELRDSNGEITAAGASIIASLFDAPQTVTEAATDDATQCNSDAQQDATRDATGLEVENAVLMAKLEAANDTIKRLETERDRLTDQLNAMTAALEREQSDRASERLLLTGGQDQRRGLFSWLKRRG